MTSKNHTYICVYVCVDDTSFRQAYRKEIYVFCNASTTAIAAIANLKTTNEEDRSELHFKFGKSKLAPHPEITVPWLKLSALVLAVGAAEVVVDEIDDKLNLLTFYSDSKVALGYIHYDYRRFNMYVNNRVQSIRRSTVQEQ